MKLQGRYPEYTVYSHPIPQRALAIATLLLGGSQKSCTKGGDHVRECITHLLSIKNSNVDDFHVSIAINI